MAIVQVSDSDSFGAFETLEDLNGDTTTKVASDAFSFTETETVRVVGDYTYHPPFSVAVVPHVYTASFGGTSGYDDPTTYLRLTYGNEYPRINASLYDPSDNPLNLLNFTYDAIRFHVAFEDGTYDYITCSVSAAVYGWVHFAWPGDFPVGHHLARFTLVTLKEVEDEETEETVEVETALLSVPTYPLHVVIREAP